MAHVAILLDSFVGHFFPTLGLARALGARGHRVHYLGVPDMAAIVRGQGCEFTEILADVLPPGSLATLQPDAGPDLDHEKLMAAAQQRYFGPLVDGQALDSVFRSAPPDVMLMLSFLGIEGLVVRYRYGLPLVLLTTFIRDQTRRQYFRAQVLRLLNLPSGVSEFVEMVGAAGVRLSGLNDLADMLLETPELALYPKAFELPSAEDDPRVDHIGTGLEATRREGAFSWESIDPRRSIIYCSLGSCPGSYGPVGHRLFQTLIDAVAPHPEWQLILSTGSDFSAQDYSSHASHVVIQPWVPQLDVLARSAVMVTHAGMGTVTECILTGVPMVAFPLAHDQHQNAIRIVHHGLGLSENAETVTCDGLRRMLTHVMGDPGFKERVALMRERSRDSRVETGVAVVERALGERRPCSSAPGLRATC